MMSRQVVAVNRDSEIKTLADLEGKRIAVQSTTKPEALFLRIRMQDFLSCARCFPCRIGN